MRNFDAFAPAAPPPLLGEGLSVALPESVLSVPRDRDGNPVPNRWCGRTGDILLDIQAPPGFPAWDKQSAEWRKRTSEAWVQSEMFKAVEKAKKTGVAPATRFTTNYAVDYGRSKGWKLIERESYDFRTRRHHDLELGSDAIFDTPDGRVAVQGAGKGERAAHYQRFIDRGGVGKAERRHLKFLYAEFERGTKAPVKEEWWA